MESFLKMLDARMVILISIPAGATIPVLMLLLV